MSRPVVPSNPAPDGPAPAPPAAAPDPTTAVIAEAAATGFVPAAVRVPGAAPDRGREVERPAASSGEAVFIGLLRLHAELTRKVDQDLSRAHGVTLSAYEVLGRLSAAPGGSLRMSRLAEQCGLSLSRVSRLVDDLSQRGLARRRAGDRDSRVVHAEISPAGRRLFDEARATFHAALDRGFLDRLSCDDVAMLQAVLGRLRDASTPDG